MRGVLRCDEWCSAVCSAVCVNADGERQTSMHGFRAACKAWKARARGNPAASAAWMPLHSQKTQRGIAATKDGMILTDATQPKGCKKRRCVVHPSSIKQTRTPRLSECRANANFGSAGISARETPCARLVYFKHTSRAKMPALPGLAGCVTSVLNISSTSYPRRSVHASLYARALCTRRSTHGAAPLRCDLSQTI
jgi:hypothetical protein